MTLTGTAQTLLFPPSSLPGPGRPLVWCSLDPLWDWTPSGKGLFRPWVPPPACSPVGVEHSDLCRQVALWGFSVTTAATCPGDCVSCSHRPLPWGHVGPARLEGSDGLPGGWRLMGGC